jgi:hemerythrin-like domain-containing protein
MKPRGPLMIEHRLIEKMFEVIRRQIPLIEKLNSIDPVFVDTVVDFIKTYADKTHHGKEEYILFRDLAEKDMTPSDKQVMQELKDEHVHGRRIVAELVKAKEDYSSNKRQEALLRFKDNLDKLILFYPEHITKEDKVFFPNTEKYLSKEDQERMLEEFWEFDRRMIHDKYKAVVELLGFDKTT